MALNGFKISRKFAKNLEAELTSNKWLNIKSSQVTNNVNDLLTNSTPNKKQGKAILVCDINYMLSPSLRTLRIDSVVSIYTKDKMLGKYGSLEDSEIENYYLLHSNKITHRHTLIGVEKSPQKAAMAWLSNNGEKLLKELNRGMKRVASDIVFNLEYINSRAN